MALSFTTHVYIHMVKIVYDFYVYMLKKIDRFDEDEWHEVTVRDLYGSKERLKTKHAKRQKNISYLHIITEMLIISG